MSRRSTLPHTDLQQGTSEAIPPPTEDEERRIHEQFEYVFTARQNRRLHPVDPDTGRPICEPSHGVREKASYTRGSMAAFPIGYAELFQECLTTWRADDAE